MTHRFRIIRLDVVQEVLDDADERRRADSQADEQEDVVLLEILRRSSIWSLDEDSWISVTRKIENCVGMNQRVSEMFKHLWLQS